MVRSAYLYPANCITCGGWKKISVNPLEKQYLLWGNRRVLRAMRMPKRSPNSGKCKQLDGENYVSLI